MLKILVAEDDVSTNKLLCAILKINGYEAIPAFNGEAALDIIDHQHIDLLLRIKALLRRARIVDEHKITVGDVVVDMDSRTVRRGMEVQTLPPKEFELLYKLLAYPERTFTRMELLDEIWGIDSESDDKTVNVHINRLRNRFYDWPEFEIQTVRGLGYRAVKKV